MTGPEYPVQMRFQDLLICVCLLAPGTPGCSGRDKPSPRAESKKVEAPAGSVKITTEPAGAAVLLRGHQRLGHTPLTLKRPDATGMRLMLVKDRYQRETFFVLVEGGRHKVVHRRLSPEQGKVLVRAGPIRGGRITINGEFVGRLPTSTEVKAGVEHVVEVTMNRFHSYKETVTVKAGQLVTVNAIMIPSNQKKPRMGWLTLQTDVPAMVYLDGTLIGSSPITKIPVPAKKHQARVASKALKLSRTVSFSVRDGETKQLVVKLKP